MSENVSILYEKLAQLIEKHMHELAYEIAAQGLESQLAAYNGLNVETLGNIVAPTVEMVSRFARTANPDEYREYTVHLIETRLAEGRNITDVLTMTFFMFEAIKGLVDHELPGVENAATRERFTRRLDGMRSISTITINEILARHKTQA